MICTSCTMYNVHACVCMCIFPYNNYIHVNSLFQGRVLNSLKFPGFHPDSLNNQIITVSNETVVIRDNNDHKGIQDDVHVDRYMYSGNVYLQVLQFGNRPLLAGTMFSYFILCLCLIIRKFNFSL